MSDSKRSGSQPSSGSDALCLTRFSRCRGEDKNATPQQTCSYTVVAFDRGETEDRCSQALALPALPLETSRLVECHNVGFFLKCFLRQHLILFIYMIILCILLIYISILIYYFMIQYNSIDF